MLGRSVEVIRDFDRWLGQLPHAHKVVVPGNHEFVLEEQRFRSSPTKRKRSSEPGYRDRGSSPLGSPITPQAGGAFSLACSAEREQHWGSVPPTDVLITQDPPWGILDRSPGSSM